MTEDEYYLARDISSLRAIRVLLGRMTRKEVTSDVLLAQRAVKGALNKLEDRLHIEAVDHETQTNP